MVRVVTATREEPAWEARGWALRSLAPVEQSQSAGRTERLKSAGRCGLGRNSHEQGPSSRCMWGRGAGHEHTREVLWAATAAVGRGMAGRKASVLDAFARSLSSLLEICHHLISVLQIRKQAQRAQGTFLGAVRLVWGRTGIRTQAVLSR